jgi:hypothetical protein
MCSEAILLMVVFLIVNLMWMDLAVIADCLFVTIDD